MIYFISGHREITQEEFNENYVNKIEEVIAQDKDAQFVVGDYWGADKMAQDYLVERGYADSTTVYHMMVAPRYYNDKIYKTKGGYQTDEERDSAMTYESDFDIAFVRDGKWDSGTAQNIQRRVKLYE